MNSTTEGNEAHEVNLYGARDKSLEMLQHIASRRSGRRLKSDPVTPEAVLRVLEAGRWAPSCANNQPWRYFLCMNDDAVRIREALLGGNYWADTAPAYIVAAADFQDSCRLDDERNYATLDLGLSMQNMFLQAHAEGLVAHPMAGMKPVRVKEILGITDNYRVMAVIALAHPGGERELSEKHEAWEKAPAARKSLRELLFNPEILESLVKGADGEVRGGRGA